MKEIEVKILNIDINQIIEKIEKIGGVKVFDSEFHAIYWDYSDWRLKEDKKLLRLRKEGAKNILAIKSKISDNDVKIQEEIEVEVNNFNSTMMILLSAGLIMTKETKKRRIEYKINEVKIDIDCYLGNLSHIPHFIEIEAKSKEDIFKYAELLGYSSKDCLPWTTYDLELYYAHLKKSEVD